MKNTFVIILLLLAGVSPALAGDIQVVHHSIEARLLPEKGRIEVQDQLLLPRESDHFEFQLHAGLNPEVQQPGAVLTPRARWMSGSVPVQSYRVELPAPSRSVTIRYSGTIQHPLGKVSQGYADGRNTTQGLISEQGVFLSISSYWFPVTENALVSFDMRLDLPDGWSAISQGRQGKTPNSWHMAKPQDDIYLVAGNYQVYQKETPVAKAQVYLLDPDPGLAADYLNATEHYLSLYQKLLGDYPYDKFALVENFWESGYGMPSFTLLGSRVIRLPFIIHSAYPHEILHNWWGNGVYVDYASGNWSEGLTSYLADHLIREQQGKGADYRRNTLKRYANYVADEEDFPLSEFRGNHGQVSQAVGYGKTLMFFHMLRLQLGDPLFIEGLRHFYRENRFRPAGFEDLQAAFEAVSGTKLESEFKQWVKRAGTPALKLMQISVTSDGDGYRLTARLRQSQPGAPFKLRVPLFIQLEGEALPLQQTLVMQEKALDIDIKLKNRPLHLSIDPRFDLFRQLDPSEQPSTLGQLFGASKLTIILPANESAKMKSSYERMARSWSNGQRHIEIVWDDELDQLPRDRHVWLFGDRNRFSTLFRELLKQEAYSARQQSIALTTQHPGQPEFTVGLLSVHSPDATAPMARKLPHYGKYSYVTFTGKALKNRRKGEWRLSESALRVDLAKGEKRPPMKIPRHQPLSANL
ncbi:M1 family metallopeptidase [Thiolapillus sp.]